MSLHFHVTLNGSVIVDNYDELPCHHFKSNTKKTQHAIQCPQFLFIERMNYHYKHRANNVGSHPTTFVCHKNHGYKRKFRIQNFETHLLPFAIPALSWPSLVNILLIVIWECTLQPILVNI